MTLINANVGFALTGSFCTFDKVFIELENLINEKANVTTIFSNTSQTTDTRFGNAKDFIDKAYLLTGKQPITTIKDAEPIGPKSSFDVMVIAPCTGNTLAKLATGITDTPVLMAAKAHLRNLKPLVICLASNDALSMNLKNIGILLNAKNIYFVPFGQDNYKDKPNSMVAHTELIIPALISALDGKQLQPVIM
ncbi:dipicolinate synthase subunit B [Mobilisporobacter senegalensis]|uniref:Dipicolinate synthase subunit B n=1 Tax=Mobilisporobacter senegalensis TaxID=1329262 RepID=A0A3N1XC52_9FIRM|nr:dipicolinate synthase subunit B [Mobilisporobacter senegalensis]ROR22337.1 dipicolinate synthase subunit B [Mobilisporobacter senegalensis]